MKVKDLQKLLENADPEREVATTIWSTEGEKTFRAKQPVGNKNFTDKNGTECFLISWVDDCPAYRIEG